MEKTSKILKIILLSLCIILVATCIVFLLAKTLQSLTYIYRNADSETASKIAKDIAYSDEKIYEFENDISSMELELSCANLLIEKSDRFELVTNIEDLSVKQRGTQLTVKEKNRFFNTLTQNEKITIKVPEGTVFDNLELFAGAGNIISDGITTLNLDLEIGAGNVVFKDLSVQKFCDIDGGAGNLTINDGEISNLDLDGGVGNLHIKSRLLGKTDIDFGVGKATLLLSGSREDYKILLQSGLNHITLDGKKVSSGIFGEGKNLIELDGGIGEINISFEQ